MLPRRLVVGVITARHKLLPPRSRVPWATDASPRVTTDEGVSGMLLVAMETSAPSLPPSRAHRNMASSHCERERKPLQRRLIEGLSGASLHCGPSQLCALAQTMRPQHGAGRNDVEDTFSRQMSRLQPRRCGHVLQACRKRRQRAAHLECLGIVLSDHPVLCQQLSPLCKKMKFKLLKEISIPTNVLLTSISSPNVLKTNSISHPAQRGRE